MRAQEVPWNTKLTSHALHNIRNKKGQTGMVSIVCSRFLLSSSSFVYHVEKDGSETWMYSHCEWLFCMCALWLASHQFRVYPAYSPMTAGIGSRTPATLVRISASGNGGWMDGWMDLTVSINDNAKYLGRGVFGSQLLNDKGTAITQKFNCIF